IVRDAASVDRSWLIHEEYSGAEGGLRSASVSRISGELVWTTMSSQSSRPGAGDRLRNATAGLCPKLQQDLVWSVNRKWRSCGSVSRRGGCDGHGPTVRGGPGGTGLGAGGAPLPRRAWLSARRP